MDSVSSPFTPSNRKGEYMGKITGRSAYGHHIQRIGIDHYRIFWTFDTKIQGSRLRYPRTLSRDTDEKGALKFSKKWDCRIPDRKG